MSPYEFAGKVRGEENERNDEFYCNTRTTFRRALAKWLIPEGNWWGKNLRILGKLGPGVILFCEKLISITLYQRAPRGSVWSAVPIRTVVFSFLQSHLIFTFFSFDSSAYVLKRKQWEEEENQMSTGGEMRNLLLVILTRQSHIIALKLLKHFYHSSSCQCCEVHQSLFLCTFSFIAGHVGQLTRTPTLSCSPNENTHTCLPLTHLSHIHFLHRGWAAETWAIRAPLSAGRDL